MQEKEELEREKSNTTANSLLSPQVYKVPGEDDYVKVIPFKDTFYIVASEFPDFNRFDPCEKLNKNEHQKKKSQRNMFEGAQQRL